MRRTVAMVQNFQLRKHGIRTRVGNLMYLGTDDEDEYSEFIGVDTAAIKANKELEIKRAILAARVEDIRRGKELSQFNYKLSAMAQVERIPGKFVLVLYPRGSTIPQVKAFNTRDELDSDFGNLTDDLEIVEYIAIFDKTDPADSLDPNKVTKGSYPNASQEFRQPIGTIQVTSTAPPSPLPVEEKKGGGALGIIIGLVAVGTAVAVASQK